MLVAVPVESELIPHSLGLLLLLCMFAVYIAVPNVTSSSVEATSHQCTPASGMNAHPGNGSAVIIGAVVAVVVVLVVGSVIVAASLIAWRVSRRERKAFKGMYRD